MLDAEAQHDRHLNTMKIEERINPHIHQGVGTPMHSEGSSQPLVERLGKLMSAPEAVANLRRYFGIDLPPGTRPFDGRHFEHLAGGGDRPDIADVFTAEDLIATQTLSVTVPAQAAVDLLEGDLGRQVSELLREVRTGVDLAYADVTEVAPGSAADRAWHLLKHKDQRGIGETIASKLLARKRPRLLPVHDQVVHCALGRLGENSWVALHEALRANGAALHQRLLQLRQTAGVPETVSALRVCDVVVWMAHHHEHRTCRRPRKGRGGEVP